MPKISVILPVYNGGEYLKISLNSVLAQDFYDFELLVVDDCSKDGSRAFLQSINDNRVRIFYNETNKGLFWNLNFMIQHSTAPLVKLWAQDDIMKSNCLSFFYDFHQQYPQAGFSYCTRDIIDENNKVIKVGEDSGQYFLFDSKKHAEISLEYGSIAGNIANVCLSREALNKVGLYNEAMKISADFEMQVRIAEHFSVGYIQVPVIQLRDHDHQLSRVPELYIYHVKEDLQLYRYLLGYVDDELKVRGRKLLLRKKLMFYYTLMLKSFFKGKFSTAREFYKELTSFEKFTVLTRSYISYLKKRIAK